MSIESEVKSAVLLGHPTVAERRRWTAAHWEAFRKGREPLDAAREAAAELEPEALLARIEALEHRVLELERRAP